MIAVRELPSEVLPETVRQRQQESFGPKDRESCCGMRTYHMHAQLTEWCAIGMGSWHVYGARCLHIQALVLHTGSTYILGDHGAPCYIM